MPLRLVFMGTPDFAVPTLTALVAAGHTLAGVYTQAAKPAGRGLDPTPSAVARASAALGLPVVTPASLKGPQAVADLAALAPDAVIVVAYGMLLPQAVLDVPPLGCLNLHASLLPRWRGAAPIQRALMAGDAETGVMVMRMEAGLDTGPVALGERMAIPPDMDARGLHDALAAVGADLMVRAVAALERGTLAFTPQPGEGVTYARKIDKAEAEIDWQRPAHALANQVRGLAPFPGAWCRIAGERVKVLRARAEAHDPAAPAAAPGTALDGTLLIACGQGALRLIEVQRAGRQPLSAEAFLRGLPVAPGTRLA